MTRPKNALCKTCPYWKVYDEFEGWCCRHAPTAGNGQYANWPMTDKEWWCGEHPALAKLRTPTRAPR